MAEIEEHNREIRGGLKEKRIHMNPKGILMIQNLDDLGEF